MNPITTLALIYLLFTLGSSAIIYRAFEKKLDASAKYFLTAEMFMSVVAMLLFFQNYDPIFTTPATLAIANFANISSEIAILFSIINLQKNTPIKGFFFAISLTAIFAIFLEYLRVHYTLNIVMLLFNLVISGITISSYLYSKYKLKFEIANNQFMRSFRIFELGLFTIAAVRVASFFSNTVVVPRGTPTAIVIVIFSIYLVFSVFRYMSYIGLRVTWVDSRTLESNPLNRDLAKAIEEKNHLLRGLIASNRVIGISALASSLAHQLSQPLTAISLQADRSKRELAKSLDNPVLINSLDEISNQSGKLAELVQNLRQLFSSRNYEFHPFNLQQVCNEILSIVEPTLQTKKITLVQNLESDPMVHGDMIQIQQVLINVFNNAIDVIDSSSNSKREIALSVQNTDRHAVLRIQDSGTGIDSALLPDIFELYKTTKQGGLGVGLWLSKTIMERHHGNITVKNGSDGGAIFEIQIPLARSIG